MTRPALLSRWLGCALLIASISTLADARAQVAQDQAADMILNSARKAYNEQNYPFAVQRFREFLQKYGGHPNANSARYGLALALLDSPERDYNAVLEQLNPLAGQQQFADYPYVLYHLGLAQRGLGVNELQQAVSKPNEAPQRKQNAAGRFAEAQKHYANAVTAFTARAPKIEGEIKELPADIEWLARSRCDQAEMELRLGKAKEARTTVEPIAKEALFAKSRYRPLGLYYHGFACYLLDDRPAAFKSLNQLAPFRDPINGTHAQYLIGRIHQQAGELAEATTAFDAVLTNFEQQKKDAQAAFQRPEQFRNNPLERARLDALLKGPPPDHIASTVFGLGVLQYEGGKFADAMTRFTDFAKTFPKSDLLPDAQLRTGFCQVNLKMYPEAIATLTPLGQNPPRLADQALFWLAKAQLGAALALDPMKVQERDNAIKTAITTYRAAIDRAGQLANQDPAAKARRGEIMLHLADALQLAKQPKDAASTYEQILNEKNLPNRTEEVTQRFATALHLAGDYARSDQVCAQFAQQFPQSPLLPEIGFRTAENAYFVALAAKNNPNQPNKEQELPKLFGEAMKRYEAIVQKFPEFDRLALARYGIAMCHFHVANYEKAAESLEKIPGPDRAGDLAAAPYLLAECLIRQTPVGAADDALADNIAKEKLSSAATLLEGFIAANVKAPEIADALLKLAYCQRRLAMREEPQPRQQGLQMARGTYEKLLQQFPNDPLAPQAVFERAKTINLQNDKGGAINELRKFTQAPLENSDPAPAAIVLLATLLREQNKAEEAATMINTMRQKLEAKLGSTPTRADWVGLLRYHHGICLQEANKFTDARQQLESVLQVANGKPIAVEAALRAGQCRMQEGLLAVQKANTELANPGLKPEQRGPIEQALQNGYGIINEAAQTFERRAEEFKAAFPSSEARARLYYDAAWAYRTIAEREVSQIRSKMQQEAHQKLIADAKAQTPMGATPPTIPLPDIARSAVPMQPAETKMRAMYQALISAFEDTVIGVEARFELAELMTQRDEFEPAVKLLREALDAEPASGTVSPEVMDKIRIRLGGCLVLKKEFESALTQFDVVAQNPKSPVAGQAHYRAAECLMVMGDVAKAVERFSIFRDKGEFHNIPGVSDRAMLRLGQALAKQEKWDASRQAFETLVQRYGNSPWVNDARYGIGWAHQNQKQYDPAVNAYAQVIQNNAGELAARAHLQTGLCRLEQKRYPEAANALLVVPFTFDYPELNPIALTEAARAFVENKQNDQAEKLLRRVLKDYPNSEWAKVAKQRLDMLTK